MDIEAERALKSAEYLFDHAKNDLGLYLLDNFNIIKDFITHAALAVPQQEPIGWIIERELQNGNHQKDFIFAPMRMKDLRDNCDFGDPIACYASSPSAVPVLSDEDILRINTAEGRRMLDTAGEFKTMDDVVRNGTIKFGRAIERALLAKVEK